MHNDEKNLLRRKIKVVKVTLAQPGRLGSLELEGEWRCGLNKEKADRLKPFEGTEMEIGEIIRLAFD
jgi:hypothetical protein